MFRVPYQGRVLEKQGLLEKYLVNEESREDFFDNRLRLDLFFSVQTRNYLCTRNKLVHFNSSIIIQSGMMAIENRRRNREAKPVKMPFKY